MADHRISEKTLERFNLPRPQSRITAERTLFVEKCPNDFPPDLAAHHVFRAAVQAGCEKISVKRGRWRYEFRVQDMVPKGIIASAFVQPQKMSALGESALKLKMCGDDFDGMRGPQTQSYVRPPWHQKRP